MTFSSTRMAEQARLFPFFCDGETEAQGIQNTDQAPPRWKEGPLTQVCWLPSLAWEKPSVLWPQLWRSLHTVDAS